MIRLGLCCQFLNEPIRFRRATAAVMRRLSRGDQLRHLGSLCRDNAVALGQALRYCASQQIGAFRINSQILPLRTHPEVGYAIRDLPEADDIVRRFAECGRYARQVGLRLSFHPDQFVLLSAADTGLVSRSVEELLYQVEVADWVGADVINIHGGGAYGDKAEALRRLSQVVEGLPEALQRRLTLENDDRVYTPSDLLPVCRALGIPLVYDVHHHRCLPDGLSVDDATEAARTTWSGREPQVHLSSPRDGWAGRMPRSHHDEIAMSDVPACWLGRTMTIDVEAKAKEVAVTHLQESLAALDVPLWAPCQG